MQHDTAEGLVSFMTVLILSVAFHEAAHAWLADRFGDGTPREHGRMTLNPFKHVHPIFTIALPAYMFWTSGDLMFMAMTPVNPRRMRDPRLHGMLTALGGPAASLVLGLACLVALVALHAVTGGPGITRSDGVKHTGDLLYLGIQLNVIGAIFNMVPIPPLDGASLLEFALPERALPAWHRFRSFSWILFAVLVFSGIFSALLAPFMDLTERLVRVAVEVGNGIAGG